MLKFLGSLLVMLALASSAAANPYSYPYGGFSQFGDSGSMKPFTRDLGGVLGAATFHSGRSLGLTGWDVGPQGGMQFYPEKNDRILRNNGVKLFGIPWAQGEIGLPYDIDAFVRGISYQGLTIAGGGVRWGPLKPDDKPWAPHLLLSGVAHAVVAQDFSADHFGFNVVGSMGVPKFTPYMGVGVDLTHLTVRNDLLDASQVGRQITTAEPRYTAGIQMKPWQFFYIHAAYFFTHGQGGSEAGLGLHF
jgi:hypothetical protein